MTQVSQSNFWILLKDSTEFLRSLLSVNPYCAVLTEPVIEYNCTWEMIQQSCSTHCDVWWWKFEIYVIFNDCVLHLTQRPNSLLPCLGKDFNPWLMIHLNVLKNNYCL